MKIKKGTIINYLKVSILSDLLIQYMDNIREDNEFSKKLDSLIKELEPLSDSTYAITNLQTNTTVQDIQNKVDSIFRHTFRDIEIK